MNRQLSTAWGQFLSQFSWDWFLTLTFRDPVKSFRAHRLFGFFVRDIERAAELPITWFRADEIGPQGGRFHIHALMGNVAHLRRMSWVDNWDRLAGYARILPFNRKRGAAFYCAKYVAKQIGDWEMSGSLAAFAQHQPILPLQGGTKPAAVPPTEPQKQRAVSHESHPKPQQPFPYMWDGDRPLKRDSEISAIYESEVTKRRGKFKQFFNRDGGSRR